MRVHLYRRLYFAYIFRHAGVLTELELYELALEKNLRLQQLLLEEQTQVKAQAAQLLSSYAPEIENERRTLCKVHLKTVPISLVKKFLLICFLQVVMPSSLWLRPKISAAISSTRP